MANTVTPMHFGWSTCALPSMDQLSFSRLLWIFLSTLIHDQHTYLLRFYCVMYLALFPLKCLVKPHYNPIIRFYTYLPFAITYPGSYVQQLICNSLLGPGFEFKHFALEIGLYFLIVFIQIYWGKVDWHWWQRYSVIIKWLRNKHSYNSR